MALREVSHCLTAGRSHDALRFADRARRLAPDNVTLLLLQANLLLQQGRAHDVLALLESHPDQREIAAARALAQCMLGRTAEALDCCTRLLASFAVDAVANLRPLAARLARSESVNSPGWIGRDSDLRLVGERRGEDELRIRMDHQDLSAVLDAADKDGFASFICAGPNCGAGPVAAACNGRELIGSGLRCPPSFGFSGWVAVRDGMVLGAARLDWAPHRAVPLYVTTTRAASARSLSSQASPEHEGYVLAAPLTEFATLGSVVDVFALLPDGSRAPLMGSPVHLHASAIGGYQRPGSTRAQAWVGAPDHRQQRLDVVIPVYGGGAATLDCLRSVLATVPEKLAEIVVVDDASPDPALRATLTDLAARGRITLLTNEHNLGFPGAANRGMRLHSDRDVVLLNSDAEPFGDWLVRLKNSAYSAQDIGTVTPLGDCASIASYPDSGLGIAPLSPADIDRIAARVNAGRTVEVPVGVGFCLYIKRSCLNVIGFFDESLFERGYGEENDLCLRASQVGWRHVVAADVFVRHEGGRSFGPLKETLMARNRHVLHARHPHYESAVESFMKADPLHPSRRAIDEFRLLECAHAPALLLTLALPGGVQRHVAQRRLILEAAGHTVLELRPASIEADDGRVQLHVPALNLQNLIYGLPDELGALREILLGLKISKIEIHHFLGLGADAQALATALEVPYQVFVHDYAWICPRVNLLGSSDRYCAEPAVEQCESCVLENGSAMEIGLSVAALRARSSDILSRADRVIAPTRDALTRLRRYFPSLDGEVQAWENAAPTRHSARPAPPASPVRVAVIGAIGIHKGYRILLECAADAHARGLALEFVVIGHTHDDERLIETGRVFITGPYAETEVDALIERESCSLAWFPSVVPETWCYALSHALGRAQYVVAFDLGAIAERLRSAGLAEGLLPLATAPATINDTLLRLGRKPFAASSSAMHAARTLAQPVAQFCH